MVSRPRLRFGMVGAGAIAQAYVQAFQHSKLVDLVAVADVREDVGLATANALKCDYFRSHDEMTTQCSLDAVLVVTPPVSHPEICISILRRGIPVLCEKPLATDGESARRMVRAAAEADVLFTMASKFRYVDDIIRAKSMVASGMFGDIILFENTFTGYVDMKHRWNSDPVVSGGGVMIDNGTHSVDILRYFLGPLAEIQAVEGKRVQDLPVEDTVRMCARTVSGVMASIDLSWSLHKPQPEFVSIYGTGGTIQVGWRESRYRRSNETEWTIFGTGYNKLQAFTSQLENFARAILGQEPLLITPEDALASVDVIEVAYDALWRDTWVPIPTSSAPSVPSSTPPLGDT